MMRILPTSLAALLLMAGAAFAETPKPGATPEKPGTTPPKSAKKPETPPKTEKTAAKVNRVTYACDGGVSMTVTYPPEGQKTRPVKIAMKDTTYFVRPAGEKYENTKIKLVFQTKGDEASLEREGKPLAEKCKAAKPGT